MADFPNESWQIFREQYPQFMAVLRQLGNMDWYASAGWSMFIGPFHAGIYAQVYKTHWYNQTLDGIHFETGMTAESLSTMKLRMDLHIGHRNLFDRQTFNQRTLTPMAEISTRWPYEVHFSKTNLSDRLYFDVPFTKSGFPKQIAAAFARMAELSPIIDEGLNGL